MQQEMPFKPTFKFTKSSPILHNINVTFNYVRETLANLAVSTLIYLNDASLIVRSDMLIF